MNLVEFFGTVVKPKKTKGKRMFKPLETGALNDTLFYIRDKDVNAFFIKTKNGFIAIDSGYKNSENMVNGLKALGIKDKVHTVFLTHLDLDHAGGLDKRCNNIYPNAKVYLGELEAKYLTKEFARKKVLGIKLASPIKLREGYELVHDEQEIVCDGVLVKAFLTPGHTLGHLSYLIGKYLFVGDTLILKDGVGYCFWDFWNTSSDMNKKSLEKLRKIAKDNDVKYVITSHNGLTDNIKTAFLHINTYVDWNKRGFVFDKNGYFDPYK